MPANILNIVIGCPGGADNQSAPRALAMLYAELLGMRILREDWLVIGTDETSIPRLAFDDPSDDLPPRWPDPERPQQIHLDLTVQDLAIAEHTALGHGATLLRDQGSFRTYADQVGHPFCLYPAAADELQQPGRLERVVFDCFSPRVLAGFYQELLGMPVRVEDSPARAVIGREDGSRPLLAFQHDPRFRPPRWPDPRYPQQLHLDLDVEDHVAAGAQAERLGAIRLPNMGGSCPVYADPAAHPFCLCGPGE